MKMIDREKLEKVALTIDALEVIDIRATCDIKSNATWDFWAWCPRGLEDEKRRKIIAIITPLVGEMRLTGEHWRGEGNGISAMAYEAQACKIVGYKTVKKIVRKEIEREPEYEEVEEERQIPITDCDLKAGKFSKEDIEVNA
jgi:hypothetical protein